MQDRSKQLIIGTIKYIKNQDINDFFCFSSCLAALNDLNEYISQLQAQENVDEAMISVDKARHLFQAHSYEKFHQCIDAIERWVFKQISRYRVDFIILRRSHWGAVRPLVDAFIDAGCHVKIVPVPMIQELQDNWGSSLKQLIINDGYIVTDFRNYDIENELPDMVVDNMAVDSAKIPEFRFLRIANLVEKVIHLEHSILTGYTEAMKNSYFRIGRSRSWQYIVPSELFVSAFPMIFRIDAEFLSEGYPEFDTIYEIKKESDLPLKKILWNIDALDPNESKNSDMIRLQQEINYLDSMSIEYPEIQAVVRLHPNFINQSKCKLLKEQLFELISARENITLDREPLIYKTYNEVSAMVTWMSSTTMFTFAATGKPFVVLPTFIEDGYDTIVDMYLLNQLYVAFNENDMRVFLKNIIENHDDKKSKRLAAFEKYIGIVDGKISRRIVQEVLKRYERRKELLE